MLQQKLCAIVGIAALSVLILGVAVFGLTTVPQPWDAGQDRDHAFRGAVGALAQGQSEPWRGGRGAGGE